MLKKILAVLLITFTLLSQPAALFAMGRRKVKKARKGGGKKRAGKKKKNKKVRKLTSTVTEQVEPVSEEVGEFLAGLKRDMRNRYLRENLGILQECADFPAIDPSLSKEHQSILLNNIVNELQAEYRKKRVDVGANFYRANALNFILSSIYAFDMNVKAMYSLCKFEKIASDFVNDLIRQTMEQDVFCQLLLFEEEIVDPILLLKRDTYVEYVRKLQDHKASAVEMLQSEASKMTISMIHTMTRYWDKEINVEEPASDEASALSFDVLISRATRNIIQPQVEQGDGGHLARILRGIHDFNEFLRKEFSNAENLDKDPSQFLCEMLEIFEWYYQNREAISEIYILLRTELRSIVTSHTELFNICASSVHDPQGGPAFGAQRLEYFFCQTPAIETMGQGPLDKFAQLPATLDANNYIGSEYLQGVLQDREKITRSVDEQVEAFNDAAIKIQAVARGWSARKHFSQGLGATAVPVAEIIAQETERPFIAVEDERDNVTIEVFTVARRRGYEEYRCEDVRALLENANLSSRVERWIGLPGPGPSEQREAIFGQDGYNDPNSENYIHRYDLGLSEEEREQRIVIRHSLYPHVIPLLAKYGLKGNYEGKLLVNLPMRILYRNTDGAVIDTEYGILQNTYDDNGICYHSCFKVMRQNTFMQDFLLQRVMQDVRWLSLVNDVGLEQAFLRSLYA